MMNRVLAIGGVAALVFAFAVVTPDRRRPAAAAAVIAGAAQVPPQRALLDRYCIGCHSQPAKAAGQEPARKLTLDDLDVARVTGHADVWERVVRKMRAGMMPPAGARRPGQGRLRRRSSPGWRTSSIAAPRRTRRRPVCTA